MFIEDSEFMSYIQCNNPDFYFSLSSCPQALKSIDVQNDVYFFFPVTARIMGPGHSKYFILITCKVENCDPHT